jgi:hypothetical protein
MSVMSPSGMFPNTLQIVASRPFTHLGTPPLCTWTWTLGHVPWAWFKSPRRNVWTSPIKDSLFTAAVVVTLREYRLQNLLQSTLTLSSHMLNHLIHILPYTSLLYVQHLLGTPYYRNTHIIIDHKTCYNTTYYRYTDIVIAHKNCYIQ